MSLCHLFQPSRPSHHTCLHFTDYTDRPRTARRSSIISQGNDLIGVPSVMLERDVEEAGDTSHVMTQKDLVATLRFGKTLARARRSCACAAKHVHCAINQEDK